MLLNMKFETEIWEFLLFDFNDLLSFEDGRIRSSVIMLFEFVVNCSCDYCLKRPLLLLGFAFDKLVLLSVFTVLRMIFGSSSSRAISICEFFLF